MTTECTNCDLGLAKDGTTYCEACQRKWADEEATARRRQLGALLFAGHKMREWSLATFPADDDAGRKALDAVEPWLWAHTYHRLLNGQLVRINEKHPEPDIDHDDHPVWRWLNSDHGPNLYLWGPVGTGKSGLAFSLLRARLELRYDWEEPHEDPAWVDVIDLLDRAKAAMRDGDGGAIIRKHYDASVLVLDDLGAERPSDWARDAIATLVHHRHSRNLPTIVTSNYAPSALAKRLGHDDPLIGQRIVSRLTENCLKVKLDRGDLRLKTERA